MPIMITCPGCKAKLRIRDEFAGKSMKCPRCSSSVTVVAEEQPVAAAAAEDEPVVAAAAEEDEPAAPATAVGEGKPKPRPAREPRMVACPECGKKIPEDATQCRYCKALLEDEEEDEDEENQPPSRYKPCPKCGKKNPKKVNWTPWGSFYGPRLFTHVRCRKCAYAYNGRTGGSNLGPAIVFITIPLLLILGLLVVVFLIFYNLGYFS
jgi:hypothetical protein